MNIVDVDQVTLAFPAHVIGTLLPKWDEIPKEFKSHSNHWTELASSMFFGGAKDWKFYPKKDVDPNKALRMISACLRSFEPQHEHKEAGVGYMLSEFFDKIEVPEK